MNIRTKFDDRSLCPLCNSSVKKIYIDFPEIPVSQCECGFVYSDRVMTSESSAEYYREYGGDRHIRGQKINAKNNLAVLRQILDLKNVRSVLDVGAGYGYFVKEFQESFPDSSVVGVELSQKEALYAREKLGVEVVAPGAMPKRHFDLVVCFEVIEHVALPIKFVAELSEYAAPGGYVLVMTDNFFSDSANQLGPEFPKWIPHTHISHFGKETICRCIESTSELQVVNIYSYTPWEVLTRDWLSRIRRKKTPSECYDVEYAMKTEMQAGFRLYWLRRFFNPMWARVCVSQGSSGALMYLLARKLK